MPVVRPVSLAIPPHGVLAVESVHCAEFEMQLEVHPFHELYYLYKGRVQYFEQGMPQAIPFTEGAFYPIRRDVNHRIEDRSQATLIVLGLSPEYINNNADRWNLWEELCTRQHLPIYPDRATMDTLDKSYRRLVAEQSAPRIGSASVIRAEMDHMLVALARLPDAPAATGADARVASVLRMLEDSFFEEWDVDMAAERAHLSRRRFSDLFREQTGTSFLDKRNTLRLEYASRLLAEGRQTIAGAAFACGFGDLTHFYRLFRKQFGQPPKEWVKQLGIRN
ncbi:TPA: hypothetical protein DDW35_02035 [Candidatus Sumerlaeota bacterium]|jgi:AraC-like DNA-binding protein|nr:hypothetical protein [Candidatus Sumerlaeota bacterium]